MITYTKRGYGFGLLFRGYGSAIPRSAPIALLSAALAVYLNLYHVEYVRSVWLNPFPYQLFGTIVGFIVVFRCGSSCAQMCTMAWPAAPSFLDSTPHACTQGTMGPRAIHRRCAVGSLPDADVDTLRTPLVGDAARVPTCCKLFHCSHRA